MKLLALLTHVAVNSTWVIAARISRIKFSYSSASVVFLAECLKFITWFSALTYKDGLKAFYDHVLSKPKESSLMLIPSALYVVQNNLTYVALANLSAATYQVTYELKILTTAFFSVLLLGRTLTLKRWLALTLLVFGASLVQWPSSASTQQGEHVANATSNRVLGLGCVLSAASISGFAGVYYEKAVKSGSQPSVVIRNVQLAFPSIFFALLALVNDEDVERPSDIFKGFAPLVWFVVVLQAFGGIVVALVVKVADNIVKGFASAASIVVASICSFLFIGDLKLDSTFILGALIVISSILLYANGDQTKASVKNQKCQNDVKTIKGNNNEMPNVHFKAKSSIEEA